MTSKSPPRKAVWPVALALLAFVRLHAAEGAQPSPTPATGIPTALLTYDSFRLVHTRNVFDPDRRPVRPVSNAPSLPATRSDYVALTGTLLSAEKSYAFFSGSRSEFNRVLTVREKIANAVITGITSANIEVERDGKHITIAVGQTVPFDNQTAPGTPPVEAPATVAVSTESSPTGTAPAASTTTTAGPAGYARQSATGATPTTPKGPPPNLDEVRRRMMEKRQQELK